MSTPIDVARGPSAPGPEKREGAAGVLGAASDDGRGRGTVLKPLWYGECPASGALSGSLIERGKAVEGHRGSGRHIERVDAGGQRDAHPSARP